MVISKNNEIPFRKRIKELFVDYLVILVFLVAVFAVALLVYTFIFNGMPKMNEMKSQFIALFTSVIPLVLIFSYLDYSKNGSIGKRSAGLKLVFKEKSFKFSLIRNCVKFLPWQVGHMGTIHGIYTDFDPLASILSIFSITFGLLLFLMAFLRKDKRHLGDLLANTQVQINVN